MNKSAQRKRFFIVPKAFRPVSSVSYPEMTDYTHKDGSTGRLRKTQVPLTKASGDRSIVLLFAKVRPEIFDGKGFVNEQNTVMASLENHRKFLTKGTGN